MYWAGTVCRAHSWACPTTTADLALKPTPTLAAAVPLLAATVSQFWVVFSTWMPRVWSSVAWRRYILMYINKIQQFITWSSSCISSIFLYHGASAFKSCLWATFSIIDARDFSCCTNSDDHQQQQYIARHDDYSLNEWIHIDACNIRIREMVFHLAALQDTVHLVVGRTPPINGKAFMWAA